MYHKNLKFPQKLLPRDMGHPSKLVLMTTVMVMVIMSLAACQPVQPVSAMKAKVAVTSRDENQALVQRFYDAVNQRKFDLIDDIFDPSMVGHELGKDGMDIKDTELWSAFPDQQITVDMWVIEGGLVTAVVTIDQTHQGDLRDAPATGNKVIYTNIDIWRVKDGKIMEVWHNFPVADIMQQIGYQLVPPAK
jgi:predicted ester cyclase